MILISPENVLTSATAPRQINTISTPQSNQFQLFHNSGR